MGLLSGSYDMRRTLTMRVWFFRAWVVFKPISLIDSIVIFVRGMTGVKVEKKSAILECGRMFA